jgi:hypothetical protein
LERVKEVEGERDAVIGEGAISSGILELCQRNQALEQSEARVRAALSTTPLHFCECLRCGNASNTCPRQAALAVLSPAPLTYTDSAGQERGLQGEMSEWQAARDEGMGEEGET